MSCRNEFIMKELFCLISFDKLLREPMPEFESVVSRSMMFYASKNVKDFALLLPRSWKQVRIRYLKCVSLSISPKISSNLSFLQLVISDSSGSLLLLKSRSMSGAIYVAKSSRLTITLCRMYNLSNPSESVC